MKQVKHLFLTRVFLLLLYVVGLVLVGCTKQPTTQPTTEGSGYDSALTADYDNALDVSTQLALGTLKLEDTDHAVDAGQAASLLPLWQLLQGSAFTSDSERNAVFKQIEKTMTNAQLATIRSMQLTQADLAGLNPGGGMPPQDGTIPQGGIRPQGENRPQGTGRQGQGGQGFDPSGMAVPSEMATRRAQMENMSEQERQQMFSQFRGSGAAASGNTALNMVIASVVRLLAERSGQATALLSGTPMPPDETPASTVEPPQTPTAESTPEVEPTATPTPTATIEPTTEPTASPTAVVEPTAEPTVTPASAAQPTTTLPSPQVVATAIPALTQIEDTDPGPPFTILISSNTAEQDPLVEGSKTYRITGLVRNDGTQTYDVSAIHVTFFDADGFRGTFTPAIRDGKLVGGEWDWHGEIDAEFSALLLAPGEVWPFSIAITAQNMASFLIHPDAVVATREWVPVEVSGVRVVQDGTSFVRFTGTATNVGTVAAKNVAVAGTLLNASGQIVSVGSTLVVQEDIAPGESVKFDLRIEKQAYASYQLYAQAERDWE